MDFPMRHRASGMPTRVLNPGIIIMTFQIARPGVDGPPYDHARADRSDVAELPR
jgi:hypothetical protein